MSNVFYFILLKHKSVNRIKTWDIAFNTPSFEPVYAKAPLAPRGGLGRSYCVSVGRDVPANGVQYSESVWDEGIFHCTSSEKRLKYTCCLERGTCLSGKWLLSYICLELEYHK